MHDHAFCAAVTPGVGAWHRPRCHSVEGLLRRLSEVRWHQGERWGVRVRARERQKDAYILSIQYHIAVLLQINLKHTIESHVMLCFQARQLNQSNPGTTQIPLGNCARMKQNDARFGRSILWYPATLPITYAQHTSVSQNRGKDCSNGSGHNPEALTYGSRVWYSHGACAGWGSSDSFQPRFKIPEYHRCGTC